MITMWLASLALAHGPEAHVRVDNHFDGEVEVLVDGRFAAMVPGDGSVDLESRPGRHDVVVRRPGTGFVLAHSPLVLQPSALVILPVEAPPATLRVGNEGEIPLRLALGGQNVFLVPHTVVEVSVTSGSLAVTATAHEPRGDFFAVNRTVWVEPGQVSSTVLRPDPTVIVVDNDDMFEMRVLVDGKDAGLVEGGELRQIWVRPGPSVVTLVDPFGRVRSETRLVVARGQESRVVFGDFYAFDPTGKAPPTLASPVIHPGYGHGHGYGYGYPEPRPVGGPGHVTVVSSH